MIVPKEIEYFIRANASAIKANEKDLCDAMENERSRQIISGIDLYLQQHSEINGEELIKLCELQDKIFKFDFEKLTGKLKESKKRLIARLAELKLNETNND